MVRRAQEPAHSLNNSSFSCILRCGSRGRHVSTEIRGRAIWIYPGFGYDPWETSARYDEGGRDDFFQKKIHDGTTARTRVVCVLALLGTLSLLGTAAGQNKEALISDALSAAPPKRSGRKRRSTNAKQNSLPNSWKTGKQRLDFENSSRLLRRRRHSRTSRTQRKLTFSMWSTGLRNTLNRWIRCPIFLKPSKSSFGPRASIGG